MKWDDRRATLWPRYKTKCFAKILRNLQRFLLRGPVIHKTIQPKQHIPSIVSRFSNSGSGLAHRKFSPFHSSSPLSQPTTVSVYLSFDQRSRNENVNTAKSACFAVGSPSRADVLRIRFCYRSLVRSTSKAILNITKATILSWLIFYRR